MRQRSASALSPSKNHAGWATVRQYILKNVVKRQDPNAFVIVSDANEVLGEGFRRN